MKILPPFTIYRDRGFYSTFPGVAACTPKELFVVFRRVRSYRFWPGVDDSYRAHHDCTSQLMLCRSHDGGHSWSAPELLYAPSEGASQDGGMYFDGRYLFANSFFWEHVPPHLAKKLRENGFDYYLENAPTVTTPAFPGGVYLLRSDDFGKSWAGPFQPDPLPDGTELFPGHPRRMHNRGNLIRGVDNSLLWVGERYDNHPKFHSDILIYRSADNGETFHYLGTPADSHGTELYEEPFLCVTPAGKYVVLIRSQRCLPDGSKTRADLVTVESNNGGVTWSEPVRHPFHAEPSAAQRLPDGRTLVVYGFRKPPFGVRGRIVSPEFEDVDTAEEFIIRDDAPTLDVGYPWIVLLDARRVLVVYYIGDPTQPCAGGIEGNIIEL